MTEGMKEETAKVNKGFGMATRMKKGDSWPAVFKVSETVSKGRDLRNAPLCECNG
jgi:hypothetical protein